jgi:hypothetical protein
LVWDPQGPRNRPADACSGGAPAITGLARAGNLNPCRIDSKTGGGNIGALMDFACESGWGLQALGKCR